MLLLYFYSLSYHFIFGSKKTLEIRMGKMHMKKAIAAVVLITSLFSGCAPIRPDSLSSTETATINTVTTLEYSIFAEREVSVFTNQIISQMRMIAFSGESNAELSNESIEESIQLMTNAYDSVCMEHAPETNQQEKETLIKEMEKCIAHMTEYQDSVKNHEDTSIFKDLLSSDFYALTAVTSTYTQ